MFSFPDQECRRTAVQWMDSISDPELLDFLPQLVQVPHLPHRTSYRAVVLLLSLFYMFRCGFLTGPEVRMLSRQSSGSIPAAESHRRRTRGSLPLLVRLFSSLRNDLLRNHMWWWGRIPDRRGLVKANIGGERINLL